MESKDPEIRVGAWDLDLTDQEVSVESLMLKGGSGDDAESVFVPDERKPVPSVDFAPGGKYRSIVKLRIKYEMQDKDDSRWTMATGWLVQPDILVTAGHCAYDWRDSFGRAVNINAYIGYQGKSSIADDPSVQSRQAKRIVTTAGWLDSKKKRVNDVSFIQLDKPFTDVKPIEFNDTPLQGNEELGVVGYPGDKSDGNEKGAHMYEEFATVKYDLEGAGPHPHMLAYKISTYAGQSGSPVLRRGTNISIGTHVYGGGGANAASVIGGKYGNPYLAYIDALRTSKSLTNHGVTYFAAPLKPEPSIYGDPESFWDTFKEVAKVGLPLANAAMSVAAPFLGPAGLVIAPLANTAFGIAGKLCESSTEGEESMSAIQLKDQGFTERALIGEAALQCLIALMEKDPEKLEGSVLDTLSSVYKSLAPSVKNVGPKLLAPMTEKGKVLESASKALIYPYKPVTDPRRSLSAPESEFKTNIDPAMGNLMQALFTPTLVPSGEEAFFDNLGNVISQGLRTGKTFLKRAIKGLATLEKLLPSQESGMDNDETVRALDILSKRAIMGEAALQAVMTMDLEDSENESFRDMMKESLQTIGSQVIKYGPSVIEAVIPFVTSLLQSPESALLGQGNKNGKSAPDNRSIKPRPSMGSLILSENIPRKFRGQAGRD